MGIDSRVERMVDRDRSIARLKSMVQIDSRTESVGEARLARWMVSEMQDLGLEASLHEVRPGRYNAVGVLRGSVGSPTLMFNGHLDTNPPTEGWTVDPWGGVVDDLYIYGLGVSNMKAGCASYLEAVRGIVESDVQLRGDVVLTFVVGELQGGFGSVGLVESGLTADYFINCEPTDLSALTLHAGAFNFEIELTGRTRHLSLREEATDAISAACELIPRLNALTFSGARGASHSLVNRAHVGIVHGGLSRRLDELRPPQVADYCRIVGSCRYAPSQTVEGVLQDVRLVSREVASRYDELSVEVMKQEEKTGNPAMPPFEVSAGSFIVRQVNHAFSQLRGFDQPTGAIVPYCFYGTDAAHLSSGLGIPGVVCGPGGKYNTMPDERVEIADYIDSIHLFATVILDVCGT